MDFKVVEQLPELEQSSFPPLPNIPAGHTLFITGSIWHHGEKEVAAGIIVTACVQEEIWKPVSESTFNALLTKHPMIRVGGHRNVYNAAWELIGARQLEIVVFNDSNYLIPTPELAQIALAEETKFRFVK